MIFVTVGTHEQPFNRLVGYMDNMKRDGFAEDVVIQTGYSTYKPSYCTWQAIFPYQQMVDFVRDARIVITHGGPSSFLMPLQISKIPIVVPRQKRFGEHVNNHQVEFGNSVADRMGNIIIVEDIENLKEIIQNYDHIVSQMKMEVKNNNSVFCGEFEKIVDRMYE